MLYVWVSNVCFISCYQYFSVFKLSMVIASAYYYDGIDYISFRQIYIKTRSLKNNNEKSYVKIKRRL